MENKPEKIYDTNWVRSGRLGLAILSWILGGILIGPLIDAFFHIGGLVIGGILGAILGFVIFWALDEHYPATAKCPYCGTKVKRDTEHKGWSSCPKCKKRLEWHL